MFLLEPVLQTYSLRIKEKSREKSKRAPYLYDISAPEERDPRAPCSVLLRVRLVCVRARSICGVNGPAERSNARWEWFRYEVTERHRATATVTE